MAGPASFPALLTAWEKEGFVEIVKEEIRFWNGSRIFLRHLNNEDDIYNYQGSEIHVLLMDEVTQFSEASYRYLRGRVRMVGLKIPDKYAGQFPRVVCTGNPGGLSHNFFKAEFVDHDSQGIGAPWVVPELSGPNAKWTRQYIRARLQDNATLMAEDPNYIHSLEGLGSPELVRALKEGDWSVVAGSYFPEFTTNSHVIEPFELPSWWNKINAVDWGYYPDPAASVWGAVVGDDIELNNGRLIPRNSIIIYQELYPLSKDARGKQTFKGGRQTPEEFGQLMVDLERGEPIADRVLDPSAFKHTSGPSEAEMFQRKGLIFRRADNVRTPRQGHRGGWMELRQRLRGQEGIPALYVFSTCLHLIRTLPMLQHDQLNPIDMAAGEDHLADALRYLCMARPWMSKQPVTTQQSLAQPVTWNDVHKAHAKKIRLFEPRVGNMR